MAEEERPAWEGNKDLYSAASEVSKNLIALFRLATGAMQANDLKAWWVHLDSAYIEADFSIKEVDRIKLDALWKKINPKDKRSYGLLKEYHLELRRLCKPFFQMIGERGDPRTAVYR